MMNRALVVALAATGCVDAAVDTASADQAVITNTSSSQQATRLFGLVTEIGMPAFAPVALASARHPGAPCARFTDVAIAGSVLQATYDACDGSPRVTIAGADPRFIGMVVTGAGANAGFRYRIDDVVANSAGTLLDDAYVRSISDAGAPWVAIPSTSVPIRGGWTQNGVTHEDSWANFVAETSAFGRARSSFTDIMVSSLLALVADALRADFARTGATEAIPDTAVELCFTDPSHSDACEGTFPPSIADALPDAGITGIHLEAAWGLAGAVCLSKLTWQRGPLGDRGSLHDPRLDLTAKFCDDMTDYELTAAGAVVLTQVQTNFIGLHRYTAGADLVTTNRAAVPGAVYAGYELELATASMRAGIPKVFGAAGGSFVRLCSYTNVKTGEQLTTTPATRPAGYGNAPCSHEEGWLWAVHDRPLASVRDELDLQLVALYRYRRSAGFADYLTTTQTTAPAGYGDQLLLGYGFVH